MKNLFWFPPPLPAMTVSDNAAIRDGAAIPSFDDFVKSQGLRGDLPDASLSSASAWIIHNDYRLSSSEILDHLVGVGWINGTELSVVRGKGYHDWEIVSVIKYGRQPSVLQKFQESRREAFNPFHGLIASSVAMALLFCIPPALGWVIKPLRS